MQQEQLHNKGGSKQNSATLPLPTTKSLGPIKTLLNRIASSRLGSSGDLGVEPEEVRFGEGMGIMP